MHQFTNQAHYIGIHTNSNNGRFQGAVYAKPGQRIVHLCEDGYDDIADAVDDVTSLFPQLARPQIKAMEKAA